VRSSLLHLTLGWAELVWGQVTLGWAGLVLRQGQAGPYRSYPHQGRQPQQFVRAAALPAAEPSQHLNPTQQGVNSPCACLLMS